MINKNNHIMKLLNDLLDKTVSNHTGKYILDIVDNIKLLSKEASAGSLSSQEDLINLIDNTDDNLMLPITKYFSQLLNIMNIYEKFICNEKIIDSNNLNKAFKNLLPTIQYNNKKIKAKDIYEELLDLKLDFVLTAHPTEVKKQDMVSKYKKIYNILKKIDSTKYNDDGCYDESLVLKIQQELSTIWLTDEIKDSKPTPLDEAKWGVSFIKDTLWDSIPIIMSELNDWSVVTLNKPLPISFMPINFYSWIGGDRDGNPYVDDQMTIQVALLYKSRVLELINNKLSQIYEEITVNLANEDLLIYADNSPSPYKYLLDKLINKITNNLINIKDILNNENYSGISSIEWLEYKEIKDVLHKSYYSLIEVGAENIAHGFLLDLIRQLECFGTVLSKIEIRQNSSIHLKTMDYICNQLGIKAYNDLSEEEKEDWLWSQINDKNILLSDNIINNDPTNVLQTVKALANFPEGTFASYIIAMCQQVSDILLVMYFQRAAGNINLLPVVPLFETGEDLINSEQILLKLFKNKKYKKIVNSHQQIMIGYSDSSKDVGILSASWLLYSTQEKLIALAQKHKVELVFFHGRGGSIPRGGWPIPQAIKSQPVNVTSGRMRITIQGEVITEKLGTMDSAINTIFSYITSIIESRLTTATKIKNEWRESMDFLSNDAKKDYQEVLRHDSFIEYFNYCTPVAELDLMSIASRPSKRSGSGSLTTLNGLRAIPWIFSWTQNRLLLPAWLGSGYAVSKFLNYNDNNNYVLKDMYDNWFFFNSLISMIGTALIKSNLTVSELYEYMLKDDELKKFGELLRDHILNTKQTITKITGNSNMEESKDDFELRDTYLLPLHIIQVKLMKDHRDVNSRLMKDVNLALLTAIAGIAAGMRNTG